MLCMENIDNKFLKMNYANLNNIFHNIKYNNEKLYLHIDENINEIELNNITEINISILTDESIKYDEFFLPIMFSNKNKYDANDKKNNDNIEIISKVYKPYIMKYVIYDVEIVKKFFEIHKNINLKNWFVGYFDKKSKNSCPGVLYLNAPVALKKKELIITDEIIDKTILDKINSMYTISNEFIEKNTIDINSLNNYISNFNNKINYRNSILVYNLGHGNCNYLKVDSLRLLFDVGAPHGYFSKKWQTNNKSVINSISHLKPNIVIISHWDIDHYKGCYKLRRESFFVPWVVSNYLNKNIPEIARLVYYIYYVGKIYFIDYKVKSKFRLKYNGKFNIILSGGNGKSDSRITNINRYSLYLEIFNDCDKCILYGDAPYVCTDICIYNNICFFVAAHHGSNMNYQILNKYKFNKTISIICETNNKLNKRNYLCTLLNRKIDVYSIDGYEAYKKHNDVLFKQINVNKKTKNIGYEYDIVNKRGQWV